MRVLLGVLAACLVTVPVTTAKESAFFALSLAPRAGAPVRVCGESWPTSRVTASERLVASVALRQGATPSTRTPFVIAVRRCDGDRLVTVRRIRRDLQPSRRAVRIRLRSLRVGEYRVEALLNGDRPAARTAIRNLVVAPTASGPPRILSVDYGRYQPTGASHPYAALRVQTQDPDGQVVGLSWEQVSPKPAMTTIGHADGACGLGGRRNGAVETSYLPMDLDRGSYRFRFELVSRACGGTEELETVAQEYSFDVQ